MKYIISTLIFVFIPLLAFASNISISTNKSTYSIEDTIQLKIEIESDNRGDAQVIVGNLQQNFTIAGQSQSTQTQIVNGDTQTKNFISLSLLANIAGQYIIGPIGVQYDDGENFSSESIDIEITGERILVNPNIVSQSQNNAPPSTHQDLSKIQLGNNSSNTQKDILGVDGEVMADIYDIKSNILPGIYKLWTIAFAILGTILMYIIHKFYSKKQSSVKTKGHKKLNYITLLRKIRKQDLNTSKEIFYGKLGNLFREYLDGEVRYGLSGKSLSEVQALLPKKLLSIYKKLYYPAYDNSSDNIKSRNKILDELEPVMRKK